MQSIDVTNWEECEAELKKLQKELAERQKLPGPPPSRLLFRGQENSCWPLSTTLERSGQRGMLFADYYLLISRVQPQIESFTRTKWNMPKYPRIEKLLQDYGAFRNALDFGGLPAYDYMAHLRHHGFPSPLLDWTQSPYIAAYFAFRRASKDVERVSIYVYCESPKGFKSGSSSEPEIKGLGPYVRTHRRHFLQQCEYTICVNWQPNECRLTPHEDVFAQDNSHHVIQQDALWKFILPATDRLKVLKSLDNYNLNAFSLFASEETLMETLALRGLGFREKKS